MTHNPQNKECPFSACDWQETHVYCPHKEHLCTCPTEKTMEERFDEIRPHTIKCHIWDFINNPKKGTCTCGKFKILDFIHSEFSLAIKKREKELGELVNRLPEYTKQFSPEIVLINKKEILALLTP